MSAPAIQNTAVTPEASHTLTTPTPTIATPSPIASSPITEVNEIEDTSKTRAPSPKPAQKPTEQKSGFFSKLFKKNNQPQQQTPVKIGEKRKPLMNYFF